jgi:hypothetical protein
MNLGMLLCRLLFHPSKVRAGDIPGSGFNWAGQRGPHLALLPKVQSPAKFSYRDNLTSSMMGLSLLYVLFGTEDANYQRSHMLIVAQYAYAPNSGKCVAGV